jgi:hypothetical protein
MNSIFSTFSKLYYANKKAMSDYMRDIAIDFAELQSPGSSTANRTFPPDARRGERRRPDTDYGHIRTERRANGLDDSIRASAPTYNRVDSARST